MLESVCVLVLVPSLSLTILTSIYRLHATWSGHLGGLDYYQKSVLKNISFKMCCFIFVCWTLFTSSFWICMCLLSSRLWPHWAPTKERLTLKAPFSHSDPTETGQFSTAETLTNTEKLKRTIPHTHTHKHTQYIQMWSTQNLLLLQG